MKQTIELSLEHSEAYALFLLSMSYRDYCLRTFLYGKNRNPKVLQVVFEGYLLGKCLTSTLLDGGNEVRKESLVVIDETQIILFLNLLEFSRSPLCHIEPCLCPDRIERVSSIEKQLHDKATLSKHMEFYRWNLAMYLRNIYGEQIPDLPA